MFTSYHFRYSSSGIDRKCYETRRSHPAPIDLYPFFHRIPYSIITMHWKLRDTTIAAWLSPSESLTAIYLILQERSKFGFGTPGQRNMCFSKRDEIPQYFCEISIPGFENGHEIKEYGQSGLEVLVSCCLYACRLLQTSG